MANPPNRSAKTKGVTSAKAWKKANDDDILDLPSGNTCKLRRPGLPKLLSQGVLPDILTPLASAAVDSGKNAGVNNKKMQAEIDSAMSKPGAIVDIFSSVDRIAAECVVEPELRYHMRVKAAGQLDQIQESYKPEWEEIPKSDRDSDVLYTDEVDDMDKMFIFQFVVGGSRDLEQFRKQFGDALGGLES